jgi:hypothetical protein
MFRIICVLALLAILTGSLAFASSSIPSPLFPPDPWERTSSELIPSPLFPPDPWERESVPSPLFPPDPWE